MDQWFLKQVFPHRLGRLRTGLLSALVISSASTALGYSPAIANPHHGHTHFETLENFDYWANLCRLTGETDTYAAALSACEQAIALRPDAAEIWIERSAILFNTEDYPDAIASADRAIQIDPDNSLAWTYRCIGFSELNESEQALESCEQALSIDGDWGRESPALAWFYQGKVLLAEERYEAAEASFEQVLLLETNSSRALAYRCQAQFGMAAYEAAIASCEAALVGNGNWGNDTAAIALVGAARTLVAQNDISRAIAVLDQALAVNPEQAEAWSAQGDLLAQLDRPQDALLAYNQAVVLMPNNSRALLGQCAMLNRTRQYEAANNACLSAIAGNGQWNAPPPYNLVLEAREFADALNQHSIALTGQGEYEAALSAINRVVGFRPDDGKSWNHRGVILWYLRRYGEALASNQQALELWGYDVETVNNQAEPSQYQDVALALFNRAILFRTVQQHEQAIALYDQALALSPPDTLAARIWANHSVALWHLQRYESALASAQQSIDLNPASPQAWYNRGTALSSLNRHDEALAAFEQVLRFSPRNADALTGRGMALIELGRLQEGGQTLQAALRIDPEQSLAQAALRSLQQRLQQQR